MDSAWLGYQTTGGQIAGLSLSNCMAMGKLLKFFLSFLMFKMEVIIVIIQGVEME